MEEIIMKVKSLGMLGVGLMSLFVLASCANREQDNNTSQTPSTADPGPTTEGYNGAASFVTDAAKKTEVLGKLEKYAMDTKLSGIPILSNASNTFYNNRVKFPNITVAANDPSKQYVSGYGFGILREGNIDGTLEDFNNIVGLHSGWASYIRDSDSEVPNQINGLNGNDTRVSGIYGNISSAFFGQRLVKDESYTDSAPAYKNQFEWYGVLAKNPDAADINSDEATRNVKPLAVTVDAAGNHSLKENYNGTDLNSTWRLYVRTGEDGLKYSTLSSKNTKYAVDVKIEDYIYAMKVLINKKTNYYRASSYIAGTNEIKGAAKYYNNTATTGPKQDTYDKNAITRPDGLFGTTEDFQDVGYQAGFDSAKNSYFIDITFNIPVDQFNAMYQIADSNLQPINPQFFQDLTGVGKDGDISKGYNPLKYGSIPVNNAETIDNILSLGPYTLEAWDSTSYIAYKKNPDWWETKLSNTYRIDGILTIIDGQSESNPFAAQEKFKNKQVDSANLPGGTDGNTHRPGMEAVGKLYPVAASTNWKLSVNASTTDMWDKLFGPNGTVFKGPSAGSNGGWNVKPLMSDPDFLDGVFFAIDRQTAADKVGMKPAFEYFSDAYLLNPQEDLKNGTFYNQSEIHKEAVKDYYPETFGFNEEAAKISFGKAIDRLPANPSNPSLEISIKWMTEANRTQFGKIVEDNIANTFNKTAEEKGSPYRLTVNKNASDSTSTNDDIYKDIAEGKFDFAFASLTGMTYNPLAMMEVMKSDNSSGFTLNWGTDTSVNDGTSLIVDGKSWSFDALWNAAVYGITVKDGQVYLPYIFKKEESGFITNYGTAGGTDLQGLTFKAVFDIDQQLLTDSAMTLDTFSLVLNLPGYGWRGGNIDRGTLEPNSFTADVVSESDENATREESLFKQGSPAPTFDTTKFTYKIENGKVVVEMDLVKLAWINGLYSGENLTAGALTRNSDGSVKTQLSTGNITANKYLDRIFDSDADATMIASFTVGMKYGENSSVGTLKQTNFFKPSSL